MITRHRSKPRVILLVTVLAASLIVWGCGDSAGSVESRDSSPPDTGMTSGDSPSPDAGETEAGGESDTGRSIDSPDDASDEDDTSSKPAFHVCDDAPLPDDELVSTNWNKATSSLIASREPRHGARDRLTNRSRPVELVAKFSYGSVQKDLEGEAVSVWIDDCSGAYRKVGEGQTNDEGRIFATVDPASLPGTGRYSTFFHVKGDGTIAQGTLRVLPRGTELMVFDIDGTLTEGNRELANGIANDLFGPLMSGDYVPETRSNAVDMTRLYRGEFGYQVVYVTARPYWLGDRTRSWLDNQGMGRGTLRLSPGLTDSLPTDDSVGDYKGNYLKRLDEGLGFEIRRAYGNSSTDIYAYKKAGLDGDRIYILGENGGQERTVDLGEDYDDHLQQTRSNYRPAEQPYQTR